GDLPSGLSGQAPYRELFEAMSEVIPMNVEGESRFIRAKALTVVVLAIGRLSMDNDCLSRFSYPRNVTLRSLGAFLDRQSPNIRLYQVLTELKGRPGIETVVDRLERQLAAAPPDSTTMRTVMGWIAPLVPDLHAVGLEEKNMQHATFRKRWTPAVTRNAPP